MPLLVPQIQLDNMADHSAKQRNNGPLNFDRIHITHEIAVKSGRVSFCFDQFALLAYLSTLNWVNDPSG